MSSFSELWDDIVAAFTSAPPATPVVACPKGALTPEAAQAWFDKFKQRSDIPWNYPNDCCYARAEVMAQELSKSGIDVGKEWNYATDNDHWLKVYTRDAPKGYVSWVYHVAPTVPVFTNGKLIRMVIDPSITQGPVTPEQWREIQGQSSSELVETNATPYVRSKAGKIALARDVDTVQNVFDKHRLARARYWEYK